MTLGYQGNSDWRDMSDYLVHFVGGRSATEQTRYEVMKAVVMERKLVAGDEGFGFAKGWTAPRHGQRSICFSEVPITFLPRLTYQHGSFGVGVTKAHVRVNGGQRVWYVDDGTDLMDALESLLAVVTSSRRWEDELWKVTRFIDRVTPEGHGRARYEFEWEREWRVPAPELSLPSIAFLFVPEQWHEQSSIDLPGFRMIDPLWSEDRIEQAMQ